MANTYLSETNMEYVVSDNENDELPLSTVGEFNTWAGNALNDKATLKNMKTIIDSVLLDTEQDGYDKIKKHAPIYYYKAISSVMTGDLHKEMLENNAVFLDLQNAAKDHKRRNLVDKNEFINSAIFATGNWNHGSNELKTLYSQLRGNRNNEFVNLIDNNSTILRQSQLNHDMFLRRRSMNQFLKIISIFLAIIILIGYMNHLEYDYKMIFLLLTIVFVIFFITVIVTLVSQRKMHALNYNRLSFPGYPYKNDDVQNRYVGDCTDPSNMRSVKCSGLA